MIVAERKPFEEIKTMLKDYKKVLTVGCGTCVAVCLAGGEKEVAILNAELKMARKIDGNPIELGATTLERQCDMEFLDELENVVDEYDALLSMACGAGDSIFGGKISQQTGISCRKYDLYRGKQGCGMVRGKMPVLRELCIGLDRRHLPGNHVCQGPI